MNMNHGIALLACAISVSLQADTVLWYRLDGFAPGEKTTSSTHIDNLANPGHNQAVCHSWTTTRGTDANWMPYGANNNFTGWVDELRITDGVLPASAFMRAMPKGMAVTFR